MLKNYWIEVKDGDDRARGIMRRHYSARHYKDGRNPRIFVGPGEKMVLLTQNCDALFIWRKFKDDAVPHQEGVNCAVFRNEGSMLSSDLIKSAVEFALERWPKERLYTYVNPRKLNKSGDGNCFKKAGWNKCGHTKGGLIILELREDK